ncbi:hypothetical protein [Neobacillus niacini]|nr:hypothetical protein [Neobacillus niacini]
MSAELQTLEAQNHLTVVDPTLNENSFIRKEGVFYVSLIVIKKLKYNG